MVIDIALATPEDKEEILNSYTWIKVEKWVDDESLSIEERFERLKKHHIEETSFLIEFIRNAVR